MIAGWVSDEREDGTYPFDDLLQFTCLWGDGSGCLVFRLAFVPQRKWMGTMKDMVIEQMAKDILEQALRLEDVRLGLFLKWLQAHNGKLVADIAGLRMAGQAFKSAVQTWLACLSAQGALWEYRLVLDEIGWWQDLDPERLDLLLKSEAGQ